MYAMIGCSFQQSLLSATFRKGSSEYPINKSPVCVLQHIDCVTLEPDPFSQLSCCKLATCHDMLAPDVQQYKSYSTCNSSTNFVSKLRWNRAQAAITLSQAVNSKMLRNRVQSSTCQLGLAHRLAIEHTLHLPCSSNNSAAGKCCCWHIS